MEMTENAPFLHLTCPSEHCIMLTEPSVSVVPGFLIAYTTNLQDEELLLEQERRLGSRLLVRECWQKVLSQAGVLISSSISGGCLQQRFQEAAACLQGRCWLHLEPLRMRFKLPCPSGTGISLPEPELRQILTDKPSFYSSALVCNYCYGAENEIILFDTDDTMQEKLRLAQSEGFTGAVYTADEPEKYPLTTRLQTDKL